MAGWRSLALGLALCAVSVVVARAHIVYGTRTLQQLVAESDLVLRARIVSLADRLSLGPEPTGADRPSVEAEVLAVLKGSLEAPRLTFVQHGHGVARFESGQEALIFLNRIGRSRELDVLAAGGDVAWVSFQEHDETYVLTPGNRKPLLAAAPAYVAALGAATPALRTASLHRASLALLTSGDAQLASSALRDLVVAPEPGPLTAEDLPVLDPVLADPGTSMGVRVALLAELERRGLVQGPSRRLALLSPAVPTRDRVTAIRAAASSGDPAVRSRLVALLGDADPEVAAAAAAAVAVPGRASVVAPLTLALAHESPRVRMAAIRGLGRIATPPALEALETASASSPDPATRRRAQAELRKREPAETSRSPGN